MSKLKKVQIGFFLPILILILLTGSSVFAFNTTCPIESVEYSEEYKEWLSLSNEERQNVIQPRMYDVTNTYLISKSPLSITRMLGASINSRYSLKDVIPDNLSIRNQQKTYTCWTFATLSSLETNLALSNYKKGINTSKIYDYSERHMEYATSKTFLNNKENSIGYNRKVGSGGNFYLAQSYLTNGSGAIAESEMPFENNENTIDISQIENKTVSSQIYDTIEFENYRNKDDETKAEIINKIKEHIQNYGSIYSIIHGNSSSLSSFTCYKNSTGAKYCNSSIGHSADHTVSIIGWDDNYSIENFDESSRPTSNGAWIIRNSWGELAADYEVAELKNKIFTQHESSCKAKGWNSAEEIPDSFLESSGYTIKDGRAFIVYGDSGIIYVSYEDVNISSSMWGIIKATDSVNYDNLYQYDEYFPCAKVKSRSSDFMLCNNFTKKTSGKEYLTQVSIYAPQTYTCKVYVNPNGTGKSKSEMQLVQLKAGESETFDVGYHTLEFAEPLEITGDTFSVVIEVQGSSGTYISLESKQSVSELWDSVSVENGKCFFASGNDFDNCKWYDLSTLSTLNSSLSNGDSTIKAFTVNSLSDDSLKNIEITTPPNKTSYFEGENFDKTGMVVTANYNDSEKKPITLNSSDYNIENGTNLKSGQTTVTITYQDKSVTQTIVVEKNTITTLKITTPPSKTEYKEGQSFDKSGMVVEATYKDGSTKTLTDYTIENGNNLKANQSEVIISFDGQTIHQNITVIANPLVEINVTKEPNKTKYVINQNFDKTGMVVTGTYQDGDTEEIIDYTIENGTNLIKGQDSVTISYENKTTTQKIVVEEKSLTNISIYKTPTKTTYIQGKEQLDLTGGLITATYNDGSTENISMVSNDVTTSGFENSILGNFQITVSYQGKTAQFEVEIKAEEKATNSSLKGATCNVKYIKAYYYTTDSNDGYTLTNVEITNITRNLNNDSAEFYYYISTNSNETEINNWIKINEEQENADKLIFTIDSRDIANYDELTSEDVAYLYIKEVVTKGGDQSVTISNPMKLETDSDIETYIDDTQKESFRLNNSDTTTSINILPNTGICTLILVIFVTFAIGFGIFVFIRYKNLSKYVK